jgi:hypothetical protein
MDQAQRRSGIPKSRLRRSGSHCDLGPAYMNNPGVGTIRVYASHLI